MSQDVESVPTPNEWVADKLRQLNMSNAALARMLGHDRTQVQRWVNSREQIPRHHLAEIAAQLGTQSDLEYALKLKEYEDFADSLKRRIRELSRVAHMESAQTESSVFGLLARKTADEEHRDAEDYASALLYNVTHASFIFRLWQDAAATGDFSTILTPQNLKLHIQYPANHFFGLALSLPMAGRVADARDQCLASLRATATDLVGNDPAHVSYRHHAMHIIGRYGTAQDQAIVSDLLQRSVTSADPVSVRLGYSGLTLNAGYEEMAEKYIWLLQRDPILTEVDLAFDAVHYGDCRLRQDMALPKRLPGVNSSVKNLVRRLSQPRDYESIQELDTLRLCLLLEVAPAISERQPANMSTARRAMQYVQAAPQNRFTHRAETLVAELLRHLEEESRSQSP